MAYADTSKLRIWALLSLGAVGALIAVMVSRAA
jgi:hypothetical protein